MANRDDRPLRCLEPDPYRRSDLKDTVNQNLSRHSELISTAAQAFPNMLTMPFDRCGVTSTRVLGGAFQDGVQRAGLNKCRYSRSGGGRWLIWMLRCRVSD
jgi:hypothetical protein